MSWASCHGHSLWCSCIKKQQQQLFFKLKTTRHHHPLSQEEPWFPGAPPSPSGPHHLRQACFTPDPLESGSQSTQALGCHPKPFSVKNSQRAAVEFLTSSAPLGPKHGTKTKQKNPDLFFKHVYPRERVAGRRPHEPWKGYLSGVSGGPVSPHSGARPPYGIQHHIQVLGLKPTSAIVYRPPVD